MYVMHLFMFCCSVAKALSQINSRNCKAATYYIYHPSSLIYNLDFPDQTSSHEERLLPPLVKSTFSFECLQNHESPSSSISYSLLLLTPVSPLSHLLQQQLSCQAFPGHLPSEVFCKVVENNDTPLETKKLKLGEEKQFVLVTQLPRVQN